MLKIDLHAHIQYKIAYGIIGCRRNSDKNLKILLILQNQAMRHSLKLKRNKSVRKYFSVLAVLTVYSYIMS